MLGLVSVLESVLLWSASEQSHSICDAVHYYSELGLLVRIRWRCADYHIPVVFVIIRDLVEVLTVRSYFEVRAVSKVGLTESPDLRGGLN